MLSEVIFLPCIVGLLHSFQTPLLPRALCFLSFCQSSSSFWLALLFRFPLPYVEILPLVKFLPSHLFRPLPQGPRFRTNTDPGSAGSAPSHACTPCFKLCGFPIAAELIVNVFCNKGYFKTETTLHLSKGQEVSGLRLTCTNSKIVAM